MKSKKESWSGYANRVLFESPIIKGYSIAEYDKQLSSLLLKYIRPRWRIVEYGTGNGCWLRYLASLCPTKLFYGYEWNPLLVQVAREKSRDFSNIKIIEGDVSEVYSNHCDLFFATEVITHFSEHKRVLSNWVNGLGKDGICILTVPNLENTSWVMERFNLSLEDILNQDRIITDSYGYDEIWSSKYFREVLESSSLEVLEMWSMERWHEHELVSASRKVK